MGLKWVTKDDELPTAKKIIREVDVVLDIGPGIRYQRIIWPKIHICCEPYEEYVQHLVDSVTSDKRFVVIQCDWEKTTSLFPSKSVDSIFLIDVVEHVDKELGIHLLKKCEEIAREQIVIFTPLGFYPQIHVDGRKDRWGMNGGEWQAHKSGWTPEDFDDTWNIIAVKEYHFDDGYGNKLDPPVGSMWAIKNLNTYTKVRLGGLRRTGFFILKVYLRIVMKIYNRISMWLRVK